MWTQHGDSEAGTPSTVDLPPASNEDLSRVILARLDGLEELFRRRLLEDRIKADFVAELKDRSEIDDRVIQSRILRPLASRLLGIIDRIDTWDGDPDPLAVSMGEEIADVLEEFGIDLIPTRGLIDPSVHRVVSKRADAAPKGTILATERRGIVLDGRVIRPAEVVVASGEPPESPE
ncbi:nucleotide exchange factor GrpE [Rhodococcus sp. IEGM 1408]|uniref:nucleotide exchange factor GrpE n=1 Tax=Rhodococcus sp. IEGM 1408 TaxID=3082220 RepID=UPI002955888B|nr:nucleotide exchange factor GrpE [Rhodococcus sp. IEGM 1408]MDV8003001.1 nucleotide exchange factor GrpE [Rhodococcus sp. IEGM 1408]